jgi:hypothetical protein
VFVALGYYAAEIGMEKFNKVAKPWHHSSHRR